MRLLRAVLVKAPAFLEPACCQQTTTNGLPEKTPTLQKVYEASQEGAYLHKAEKQPRDL